MNSRLFRILLFNLLIALLFTSTAATRDYNTPSDQSTPDDRDIVSSSRSASASSSTDEPVDTATPASSRAMRSTSPIIRGTIDNDPRWWKTSERYEISGIDGYKESYDSEEPIVFYVTGSSDKMDVTKENGFYVAAGLTNLTDSAGDIASVQYDSLKRAWQVKITGKRDSTKQYEVSIHLICGVGSNSPCAAAYGSGSTINKFLPVQIY